MLPVSGQNLGVLEAALKHMGAKRYPDTEMRVWPMDRRVSRIAEDDARLVVPIAARNGVAVQDEVSRRRMSAG